MKDGAKDPKEGSSNPRPAGPVVDSSASPANPGLITLTVRKHFRAVAQTFRENGRADEAAMFDGFAEELAD